MLDRLKRDKLSDTLEKSDMFYEQPDLQPLHSTSGTHLSTCGHVMHLECFKIYRKKAKEKEHRFLQLPARTNKNSWMAESEFSCMLCSRLCNVLLPLIERKRHYKNRFKTDDKVKKDKECENIPLWQWIQMTEDEISPVPVSIVASHNFRISSYTPR